MQKIKQLIGKLSAKIITRIAKLVKIDLIPLAYSENGISKSYNYTASGEHYFINRFLPTKIEHKTPVFFDVGANKGDYSKMLRSAFPEASIFSFEPNPNTFQVLESNLANQSKCINKGVGEKPSTLNLYFDKNDKTSVQASSDKEILKEIAQTAVIDQVEIGVITIDDFANEYNISSIDLLKIDVEGFELEVIDGASNMINSGKVKMIQFEFNEVNIIKRRFLKDFYDLLPNYSFHRLDEDRLIPLNNWKPGHEIFQFQNIIAIKN